MKKNWKPRVTVEFNTASRPHRDKSKYTRKVKHKKDFNYQRHS